MQATHLKHLVDALAALRRRLKVMEASGLRPQTPLPLVHDPPLRQVHLLGREVERSLKADIFPRSCGFYSLYNTQSGSFDLIGTDDKHNAVHVGLRAHFLFHLAQPAVQRVETLTQAHVVHQQHTLTVLVEFVAHLEGEKRGSGREEKNETKNKQKPHLAQQHLLMAGLFHKIQREGVR